MRREATAPVLAMLTLLLLAAAATAAAGQEVRLDVALDSPQAAVGAQAVAHFGFLCPPDRYVQKEGLRVALADAGDAGSGIAAGAPVLPEHKLKYDPFLEATVEYFDGEFTVDVVLSVGPEVAQGDHALTFDVRYALCGPNFCRFEKASLAATLSVVEAGAAEPQVPLVVEGRAAPSEDAAIGTVEDTVARFAEHGILVAVLLAFVAGLGLTLTPCIYPLIPVTVSLVGATSGRRRLDGLVRSLVYVLGISITYSIVGVLAAVTGGIFGVILQHPAVYVALAVIFVLLAGAMFDWYSFDVGSQKLQILQARLQGKWGLLGVLLVGLLSGTAATACIAPIITAVLFYVGQKGSAMLGFLMFFAMAWGMGTPLVVLGTFTGLVRALPKSGEWMVRIKQVFGLALLGVAVYFVGRSDLLPALWFGFFVAAVLLGASVFVGAFDVLARRAGLWLRLRKTAGLLLLAAAVGVLLHAAQAWWRPVVGLAEGPPEDAVEWLDSEPGALARAEGEGKPVLLDFWAERCPACDKMLKTTFRAPAVVAESGRFVAAKIDLTDQDDPEVVRLQAEYSIPGVPFIVLVGTDGGRRSYAEYVGPERMLELMQAVR